MIVSVRKLSYLRILTKIFCSGCRGDSCNLAYTDVSQNRVVVVMVQNPWYYMREPSKIFTRSMSVVDASDITLKPLHSSAKTISQVLALLRHQPREYYQAWSYGEPSEKSVRTLLSCDSVFGILLYGEQLVGIIGFAYKGRYFIPLYNGQYWIHYLVDKEYAGRGIVSIAITKLLKIIRDETDIRRIYAGIYSKNLTGLHVVKKFGFIKREEKAQVQVFEKIIT